MTVKEYAEENSLSIRINKVNEISTVRVGKKQLFMKWFDTTDQKIIDDLESMSLSDAFEYIENGKLKSNL